MEFSNNLGKAAEAKHAAKDAIKRKKLDEAWRLLHEQKWYYGQHVNSGIGGFTPASALALNSTVHEDICKYIEDRR
tara:strand:- start:96 stop:323 length:228 start_codon:yes stop_codon:yes gene_type:complete